MTTDPTCDTGSAQEFQAFLDALRTGGSRPVSATDRLGDLGYDSLAILEMILAVEAHYGVEILSTVALTDVQTVSDLYQVLRDKQGERP
ncbi:acyl carrier protein [Micromonospora auratinigra]|uniref:Acyl carrier protein n=1 Tax=Micromonospora auratinigra TaxID=261654 RepID=A0A1A8Z4I0_9ACTN|nr:acyl carrier protein [Micromonospora auratinigra]SBT38761.1 acyl carrier protein [Micromonospora auratinigra]